MALPTTPIFRGFATVEGTAGTFDCLAANVTGMSQSGKLTQIYEEEILKDVHGGDVSWIMRNEHATMDIDLYFVATTAAIAKAPVISPTGDSATTALSILGYPFLGVGSVITLSGWDLTGANGSWRVLSGSDVSLTNTNAAKYTLKLLKYANADQETQIELKPT